MISLADSESDGSKSEPVLTFSGSEQLGSSLAPVVIISLAISDSDGSTSESVLTFSGNEHSRSLPAQVFCTNFSIKLKSFTYVAIDEITESEANKGKFETEVESISPLTSCQVFLHIIM